MANASPVVAVCMRPPNLVVAYLIELYGKFILESGICPASGIA